MIAHEELLRRLNYNPYTGIFTWIIKQRGSKRGIGTVAGSVGSNGYTKIKLNGRHLMAHRLAWFFVNAEWPNNYLDHINRIKADNRIENLRLADCCMNMENIGPRNPASGKRGVYFSPPNSWRAARTVRGHTYQLGCFRSIEEAARKVEAFDEQVRREQLSTPEPPSPLIQFIR